MNADRIGAFSLFHKKFTHFISIQPRLLGTCPWRFAREPQTRYPPPYGRSAVLHNEECQAMHSFSAGKQNRFQKDWACLFWLRYHQHGR